MKYQGYTGTILQVDLSQKKIESVPLAEKLAEDYIGGVGIAAALIDESLIADLNPLDETKPSCLHDRAADRYTSAVERTALRCNHFSTYWHMG